MARRGGAPGWSDTIALMGPEVKSFVRSGTGGEGMARALDGLATRGSIRPMDFLPRKAHARRMAAAYQRRVADLRALGSTLRDARGQASNEFAIYDLVEIDDRGWIRIANLDLDDPRDR